MTKELTERLENRLQMTFRPGLGRHVIQETVPDLDCAEAARVIREQQAEIESLQAYYIELNTTKAALSALRDSGLKLVESQTNE